MIVSSRDRNDQKDEFTCLDFETGLPLWTFSYPALGKLDYGNSPRATPIIADPYVITLGPFGNLHCIDIETGKMVWKKHMLQDLGGKMPIWGFSASPIVVGDRLIVQPGGEKSSIIALKLDTGDLLWATEGRPAAYASPITISKGGTTQIIGFDDSSLGSWDLSTGKRLWEMKPKAPSDFNVPAPIAVPSGIVLMSENNATRLHRFDENGNLRSEVAAEFPDMAGDSHSPLLLGNYIVGVDHDLFVLDVENGLKEIGRFSDKGFGNYCSLIGFENRVLALGGDGEAMLLEIGSGPPRLLSRFATQKEKSQMLSHPAMVGTIYLVRGPDGLDAWDLSEK